MLYREDFYIRLAGFALMVFALSYGLVVCGICGFMLGSLREARNPPRDIFYYALASIVLGLLSAHITEIPIGDFRVAVIVSAESLISYGIGYSIGRWALSKKIKYRQTQQALAGVEKQLENTIEAIPLFREIGKRPGYSFALLDDNKELDRLMRKRDELRSRLTRYA